MDFLTLAKERYSLRKYDSKPVEQEKIDKLIEVAKLAPTGHNNMPQKVYVITDKDKLEQIKEVTPYHFNAPLIMLFCNDTNLEWKSDRGDGVHSGEVDVAIVGTHVMLMATELGLGTCWVRGFANEDAIKAFNLPENEVPIMFMTIGYPVENAKPAHLHETYRDPSEWVEYIK